MWEKYAIVKYFDVNYQALIRNIQNIYAFSFHILNASEDNKNKFIVCDDDFFHKHSSGKPKEWISLCKIKGAVASTFHNNTSLESWIVVFTNGKNKEQASELLWHYRVLNIEELKQV